MCFKNSFHTGSKYDVTVLTVSFPFPRVKFLFVVVLLLSRAVSASGVARRFWVTLPPSPCFLWHSVSEHSLFAHGVLGKGILDFYSVKCLVRWIVGRNGNLGETWWKLWLSVIIKLFMSWLSSLLIIRLFPYFDYRESVILQKTSLKDLILVIKSRYQGRYHSLDSRALITMSENPVNRKSSRHIDTHKHFNGQLVEDKTIVLEQCVTDNMVTDSLTKGLPDPAFEKHKTEILWKNSNTCSICVVFVMVYKQVYKRQIG